MMNIRRIYKHSCFHKLLAYVFYSYADFRLRHKGYVYEPDGVKSKFYLPYVKTDMIQKTIYRYRNYFESYSLNYICKKWMGGAISIAVRNKAVLDIGSNIGNHSLYFLNECDAKFVYCFEPALETFEILKTNISINCLEDRVKLFKVGVGRASGKGSVLSKKTKNTGFTQVVSSGAGDIEMIAIDELGLTDKIGLIKIDIEGYEFEALNGMIKTIIKDKPYLMVEVDVDNIDEVCSLFDGLGYCHVTLNQYNGNNDNYLFYPKG